MSGDGDSDYADELVALSLAIDRMNQVSHDYRELTEQVSVVDEARELVLGEVDTVKQAVRTLCTILVERGQLMDSQRRLIDRLLEHQARAGKTVRLRVVGDKHQTPGPDIDCASRLHLCKARCCTLQVELAREDIDDGIRFDVDNPYVLVREADGWCHYIDRAAGGGCTIYDKRPATCRKFDCRQDKRIWVDFEAGIPAE